MTQTALAPLTINISEEAAGHVRVFAEQSGLPDSNLRVSVKGGGCAGMTYVLDLVDEPREDDKLIEEHGAHALRGPQVVHLPSRYDPRVLGWTQRQRVRVQQPEREDNVRLRHFVQRVGQQQEPGIVAPRPL